MIRQFTTKLALAFMLCGSVFAAGVPNTISYQGRLTDSAGVPVQDGAVLVKFTIYDAAVNGTASWNSGFQTITTLGGLFSYDLGSNVALPDLFGTDSARYLGITVGVNPENSPRTRFNSSGYVFKAQKSDFALNADSLGGMQPAHFLDWNNLSNVPAGFADGVDNSSSGDITGVAAGSGLTGGGTSGSVTLSVGSGAITATHIGPGAVGASEIANGSIANADISNSANIATSKISGTAVNLTSNQSVTGIKTFSDLRLTTTTRRMSIAPPAFRSSDPSAIPQSSYSYAFSFGLKTFGATGFFYASVSIPDGATVSQLVGNFKDSDNGNWTLTLSRINPIGSRWTMATVSTNGLIGNVRPTDNTVANALVNNDNYVYVLELTGKMLTGATVFVFYGAEIEYTITKPLP